MKFLLHHFWPLMALNVTGNYPVIIPRTECGNICLPLQKQFLWIGHIIWTRRNKQKSKQVVGRDSHPLWLYYWRQDTLTFCVPIYLAEFCQPACTCFSYYCCLCLVSHSWYSDQAGWSRVQMLAGARDFVFSKTIQTGFGSHWASYSVGTRVLSGGVWSAGAWCWPHISPSCQG
jgi:hypothetical protein